MFEWDDILIVGDSFASHRNKETDWPRVLISNLTGCNDNHRIIRGKGFTGASWWSTRKEILHQISHRVPKLLIVTHTEPQRIPHVEDLPLNTATVFNDKYYSDLKKQNKEYIPIEILHAGQHYYKHLFVEEFHLWAQENWFAELDKIVLEYSIPYVIHLHAFEPWKGNVPYIFKHGLTFVTPLWEVCDDNKAFKKTTWKNAFGKIKIPNPELWNNLGTRNHFLPENNVKLAEQILEAISNYSLGKTITLD